MSYTGCIPERKEINNKNAFTWSVVKDNITCLTLEGKYSQKTKRWPSHWKNMMNFNSLTDMGSNFGLMKLVDLYAYQYYNSWCQEINLMVLFCEASSKFSGLAIIGIL